MLFNEPKLLKSASAEEAGGCYPQVSVLFNEPKLLKFRGVEMVDKCLTDVSVLFNEPKLLKCIVSVIAVVVRIGFSALQRAEIAEIVVLKRRNKSMLGFSALQRAEIAEMSVISTPLPERLQFQCSSTSRNC